MAYLNGESVPDDYSQALKRRVGNLHKTIRRRANTAGTSFNLELADLYEIIPADEKCPVFNLPFDVFTVKGGKPGPKPMSVSCDRIEPDKGYVRGNIRLISMKANRILSNVPLSDLQRVVAWAESN